jgi:hypothetical protein
MRAVDPIAELKRAAARHGSQRRWALAHNLSPQYVTDVLQGRRDPGPGILDALGLVRVVAYYRAKPVAGPPNNR